MSHEPDERNQTIQVMINAAYVGKVQPVEDETLIAVEAAVDTCQGAGFPVTERALAWALKTGRLKPEAGRVRRGELLSWAQWRDFNYKFGKRTTTARGLAVEVYNGHAFAPVYQRRRKKENFVGAWHIALDFDTGDAESSLETLSKDEFAWMFAAFGYSTPSSTPQAPKSRLVFVFPYDDPIVDIDEYEALYRALLWRFPAADRSTKDALRLFYGSPKCEVWANWSIFPKGARDVVIAQHQEYLDERRKERERKHGTIIRNPGGDYGDYIEQIVTDETDRVRHAREGERHHTLYTAGRTLGGLVGATWNDLTRHDALSAIKDAASSWTVTAADVREVERTAGDGIRRGEKSPTSEPYIAVPAVGDLIED